MKSHELLSYFWDGCLPVNIIKVARNAGFNVIFTSDKNIVVDFFDCRHEIVVGKDVPNIRQRWAIAHALGRIYCGSGDFASQMSDFASNNKDMLYANRYAANLLMPEKIVLYLIGKGETDVDKLAKLFNVSPAAMAYQLSHMLK